MATAVEESSDCVRVLLDLGATNLDECLAVAVAQNPGKHEFHNVEDLISAGGGRANADWLWHTCISNGNEKVLRMLYTRFRRPADFAPFLAQAEAAGNTAIRDMIASWMQAPGLGAIPAWNDSVHWC